MNLYAIFGALSIIGSVLLVLVVIVQNSKGGGLSSTFGASNLTSMIGTRRATQDIEKITWYLAFGLMVVSFIANFGLGGTYEDSSRKFSELGSYSAGPGLQPEQTTQPDANAGATQPVPGTTPDAAPGGGE